LAGRDSGRRLRRLKNIMAVQVVFGDKTWI
jgi:hypothetical protein